MSTAAKRDVIVSKDALLKSYRKRLKVRLRHLLKSYRKRFKVRCDICSSPTANGTRWGATFADVFCLRSNANGSRWDATSAAQDLPQTARGKVQQLLMLAAWTCASWCPVWMGLREFVTVCIWLFCVLCFIVLFVLFFLCLIDFFLSFSICINLLPRKSRAYTFLPSPGGPCFWSLPLDDSVLAMCRMMWGPWRTISARSSSSVGWKMRHRSG